MKAKKPTENTTTNKEEYFISVSSIYQILPNFYSLNNINTKLYKTELHGKIHKLIIAIGDLTNLYHSGSFSEPTPPTKVGKNILKNTMRSKLHSMCRSTSLHPKTANYRCFPSTLGTFLNTDHILIQSKFQHISYVCLALTAINQEISNNR